MRTPAVLALAGALSLVVVFQCSQNIGKTEERVVSLRDLCANPAKFRDVPIRFTCIFRGVADVEPTAETELFSNSILFSAWPVDARLWEEDEYANFCSLLFFSNGSDVAARISTFPQYAVVEVRGTVASTVVEPPSLKVADIVLLDEKHFTEESLARMKEGLDLCNKGEFKAAIPKLLEAVSSEIPDHAASLALRWLGYCYVLTGEYFEAAKCYARAEVLEQAARESCIEDEPSKTEEVKEEHLSEKTSQVATSFSEESSPLGDDLAELTRMAELLAQKEEQVKQLAMANAEMQIQLEEVCSELERLKRESDAIVKDFEFKIEDLRARLAVAESEREEERQTWSARVEALQTRLEETEKAYKEKEQIISKLEDHLRTAEVAVDVTDIAELFSNLMGERETARQQAIELAKQVERLQTELDVLKKPTITARDLDEQAVMEIAEKLARASIELPIPPSDTEPPLPQSRVKLEDLLPQPGMVLVYETGTGCRYRVRVMSPEVENEYQTVVLQYEDMSTGRVWKSTLTRVKDSICVTRNGSHSIEVILMQPLREGYVWGWREPGTVWQRSYESFNVNIITPAGPFSCCVKVKSKTLYHLGSWPPLEIVSYQYYAPSVGLVKVVMEAEQYKPAEIVLIAIEKEAPQTAHR